MFIWDLLCAGPVLARASRDTKMNRTCTPQEARPGVGDRCYINNHTSNNVIRI